MYSLCYILEAIFIFGVKVNELISSLVWTLIPFFQDVALIAAICGFLSSCVLLSHIFPTFLIMSLPRPTNTNVTSLPSSPNSSDNPPGYDTLMASQLPGYDDSIVQKTNLPVQVVLFCGMVNNMKYHIDGVIDIRKSATPRLGCKED